MLQPADPSREGRTTSSCIDMPWGPPAKASIILGWPDFGERKKHTDYILELLTYLLIDEIDHLMSQMSQKYTKDHRITVCPRSFWIKARLVRIPHNQWIHAFPRSLRKKNVRLRCPTSSFLMVRWINCKGSRTLLLSDQHLKWWIWLYLHCNFEVMKIWSVSPTCILILTKVSCKWEYQASVDMFCNHFPTLSDKNRLRHYRQAPKPGTKLRSRPQL